MLYGLSNMNARLQHRGGKAHDRNVKQKLNSLYSAIGNSYQSERITFNGKSWECLINVEKVTTDYDQYIISIDFNAGLESGDTFYWDRTGKYWIVYTVFDDEEAYFRARIRKCDFAVEVNNHQYWTYVRGPVETALVWKQKHKIELNELNYSILLYIKNNPETRAFFSRHQIVKFDGHNWRVAATDKYSQDGVIEVYLEEYFDNDILDNMVQPEVIQHSENDLAPYIEGPQNIKVYDTEVTYSIVNSDLGRFIIESNKVKMTEENDRFCTFDVVTAKKANIEIKYEKDGEVIAVLPVHIGSF